jgi:Flp pilus assembly pilin Flp
MLKVYEKTRDLLQRLRKDKDGVVSWEYLLVAAVIIVAVGTAFGTGGGNIQGALTNGIADVVADFNAEI